MVYSPLNSELGISGILERDSNPSRLVSLPLDLVAELLLQHGHDGLDLLLADVVSKHGQEFESRPGFTSLDARWLC